MKVDAFLNTLPIMGRGMLGIFAVMLVIFLLITPVFWYNSVPGNPYKWRRAA